MSSFLDGLISDIQIIRDKWQGYTLPASVEPDALWSNRARYKLEWGKPSENNLANDTRPEVTLSEARRQIEQQLTNYINNEAKEAILLTATPDSVKVQRLSHLLKRWQVVVSGCCT